MTLGDRAVGLDKTVDELPAVMVKELEHVPCTTIEMSVQRQHQYTSHAPEINDPDGGPGIVSSGELTT